VVHVRQGLLEMLWEGGRTEGRTAGSVDGREGGREGGSVDGREERKAM